MKYDPTYLNQDGTMGRFYEGDSYIQALRPDYITIENVVEIMSWGPVDDKGKPISKLKGRDYMAFNKRVKSFGYNFDYRILNSADFGALTSRKRYFAQFALGSLPISWPQPTHAKNPVKGGFFNNELKKWRAVRSVLDLTDEGQSIFTRTKALSDKTLERIYAGLIKFVAGGKDKWLLKYNSVNGQTGKHNPPGIDEPCPVISTQNRIGLVSCQFMPAFISAYYGIGDNVSSIDAPAPTVTTKDRLALVSPKFIDQQFGQSKPVSVDVPCNSITANPKFNLVSCKQFIMNQFTGGGQQSSIESPSPSVTTVPKQNLITCEPWGMNTSFNNIGSSIDEPAPVITANRKWHYLMNPQYNSHGGSIDSPCFTLIAKMDKRPPYLVETEEGYAAIEFYETDSEITIRIKEFMCLYGITDIKMRMLRIPELLQIMGFPIDYVLVGTQAVQKKQIGNAVEVNIAKMRCEAIVSSLTRKSMAI
jgi:DNA (cytosine-5)-methyltransferase 1